MSQSGACEKVFSIGYNFSFAWMVSYLAKHKSSQSQIIYWTLAKFI